MVKYLLTNKKSVKFLSSKKAQAWGLDLAVAIVIFLAGVLILYVYAINYTSQSQETLEEMKYESNLASQLILSEDDFGILTDGKVNQTKLDNFHDNYESIKNTFGLRRDFYFVMENLTIDGAYPAPYAGKINSGEVSDLIQTTRITIYKNKPIKFEIFIWENEE